MLEAFRRSGDKYIVPDKETRAAIFQSNKDKVVGSYKLCIDTAGQVSSVTQVKSTEFPAYDAKIIQQIHTWTYWPFTVNGKAVAVCTLVTFIYRQS